MLKPRMAGAARPAPLRIGITGAQGVGKSTLAVALGRALQIPVIEEVARTVFELGFCLGPEATSASHLAIWLGQYDVESRTAEFVADRILLDAAAHCSLLAEETCDPKDQYIANVIGNATSHLIRSRYSHLFYLPVEFRLAGDSVRSESLDFQQKLDRRTRDMLPKIGAEWTVLTGSLESRLATALAVVRGDIARDRGWRPRLNHE